MRNEKITVRLSLSRNAIQLYYENYPFDIIFVLDYTEGKQLKKDLGKLLKELEKIQNQKLEELLKNRKKWS